MPWAKIDDRFYLNPKVMRAGLEGRALYVAGLVHAAGGLTDGIIECDVITRLAVLADVTDAAAATARLVSLNLWEEIDGAYRIHDYLEYNPSREHMQQVRQVRSDAGRLGGRPSNQSALDDGKQNESNLLSRARVPSRTNPVPSPVPNPYPTQDVPIPNPSPSEPPRPVAPASIEPAKPAKYSAAFETFWRAYPRQDGRAWPKPTTYDEWRKFRPDGELADAILAGVVAWKAGRDWRRGFISRPDRWLKARSWEEPPEPWSGEDAVEQRAPTARASPNGRQSKMDIIAAGLGMTRRPTDDRARTEPGPGEFIDVVAASGDGRGHRVAVAGTLP